MSWLTTFIDSTIGKKLVMALTGLFLCTFLVAHLGGNLLLLKQDGGAAFEEYSEFMANPKNLPIRILEIGIFVALLFHFVNGIRLAIQNKKARPVGYKANNASANSTFSSRFMLQSGSIIFIFLVLHLRTFFVPHRIYHSDITMYESVAIAFQSPVYSLFYVIAMILMAIHLNHGFQSGFQTFGINNKKYSPFIKKFGTGFAIIISAGFASLPIYFYLRYAMGGN